MSFRNLESVARITDLLLLFILLSHSHFSLIFSTLPILSLFILQFFLPLSYLLHLTLQSETDPRIFPIIKAQINYNFKEMNVSILVKIHSVARNRFLIQTRLYFLKHMYWAIGLTNYPQNSVAWSNNHLFSFKS